LDELFQDQHIKLMPDEAIALVHEHPCLLLRPGGTTQRDTASRITRSALRAVSGEHFDRFTTCPGSRSAIDLTPAMEAAKQAANTALVQEHLSLIRSIVRALTPGNGRANICESEDELKQRLAEDGSGYEPEQFPRALELLENNGDGNYDTGALPGLQYKIIRADPPQPTAFAPYPPRPLVLEQLRIY
jgi:hypothetical protein